MVNVAMIEGGLVHNIVPELCKLTVDIRFPPEQTAEDVLRDVHAAVATALAADSAFPTTIEPEATCVRNPRSSLRLREDHPLVRWLVLGAARRRRRRPAGDARIPSGLARHADPQRGRDPRDHLRPGLDGVLLG